MRARIWTLVGSFVLLSACSSSSQSGDSSADGSADITSVDGLADVATVDQGLDALSDSGVADTTGCTPAETLCGSQCVDTQSSPDHCGNCATACASGQVCNAGRCGTSCPSGQTVCNGLCVTLATDVANCGACATACPTGEVCSASACGTQCTGTLTTCSSNGTPTCTDTQSDRLNCGTCGNACPSGNICVAGACTLSCVSTETACNGRCVDLTNDVANCGACGVQCPSGQVCSTGQCTLACAYPLSTCGGGPDGGTDAGSSPAYCANLQTDRSNCGTCGTMCPTGDICTAGQCTLSCPTGETACNGACVFTDHDPQNCGACGTNCAAPNSPGACISSACVLACAPGYGDCDGIASNGCETPLASSASNCGRCGNVCSSQNSTDTCMAGTCMLSSCTPGYLNCDLNPANGCEVNPNTDTNNCGACGSVCLTPNATPGCSNGACGIATCSPGFQNCNGVVLDGCEVNDTTDPNNCGGCGLRCSLPNATSDCANGACGVLVCINGYANCDGTSPNGCEVNIGVDPNNCGGCHSVCMLPNASAGCAGGACTVASCSAGYQNCDNIPSDGCETNTNTDPNNCGGCFHACFEPNATPGCAGGNCTVAACNTNFANCDGNVANGCETNTQTDPNSCGGCGHACGAGFACNSGVCGFTTHAPVQIPGPIGCLMATSSNGRKIAIDGSNVVYVAMNCANTVMISASNDGGTTYGAPVATGITGAPVNEIAIAGLDAGGVVVAAFVNGNEIIETSSTNRGVTYAAPVTFAGAQVTGPGAAVSVATLGTTTLIAFPAGGTLAVERATTIGGAFAATPLSGSLFAPDVMLDRNTGHFWVDQEGGPAFESTNNGASFTSTGNDPGGYAFSDFAFGGTTLFHTGTTASVTRIATPVLTGTVIPLAEATTTPTRSVTADTLGDAFVVTDTGNIVLERVLASATTADPARVLATGTANTGYPTITYLPSNNGAAIAYALGGHVFATTQSY